VWNQPRKSPTRLKTDTSSTPGLGPVTKDESTGKVLTKNHRLTELFSNE